MSSPSARAAAIDRGIDEIWRLDAAALVGRLRVGAISPTEAVRASIRRIEAVDPQINALPIRCFDRALETARRLERESGRQRDGRGWLAGLPIAVKDVTDVAGVRSTFGSKIFAQRVPPRSDLAVEALERRGAIVMAKSNTPEFASSGGLNTANALFGATHNPWNPELTPGGSSGGSAAALASGQVWLATGTDLGGSLRQPASFCGVVGLRPTPGVVARGPMPLPHDRLCVTGPMGRTVADVALMLDAMAGDDGMDPIALPAPLTSYRDAAAVTLPALRIAYSADLGLVPVAREIALVCERAALRFAETGATVEQADPDLHDAADILAVLRPAWLAAHWGSLLQAHGTDLQSGFRARLEQGMRLPASAVWEAERRQARLALRMMEFFSAYDVLACPTVPVAPFPADTRRVDAIDGCALGDESRWMLPTYAISLTGCPAISLPCGYTADGRPVGLQLIAAPRTDGRLLAAAAMLERRLAMAPRAPVDPPQNV